MQCPYPQTYDRSICYKSYVIRSFCQGASRQNREKITDTPCAANEVCVQRLTGNKKPYASCIPIVDLVSWRTGPAPFEQGCTNIDVAAGGSHYVGTILYDVNDNQIEVSNINYHGEPGDTPEGTASQISILTSLLFLSNLRTYMQVCITSGGYTNLKAYTWAYN
ncbi:uncharacterized protein RAG0_13866 [Rhynchosporium agropyri]|uniref:Uncharacterized protein n=1 Tax=Rhynchosporium agropyri TaxID=914238 RepID=A0A1E1LEJ0_9HELO|nr:uncharacterized protein RAG0_13866 [Rhynchosporium agropyri]